MRSRIKANPKFYLYLFTEYTNSTNNTCSAVHGVIPSNWRLHEMNAKKNVFAIYV